MKYALIVEGKVNKVYDEPFDVAQPWYFVMCPEDTQEDSTYDPLTDRFTSPPERSIPYTAMRNYPSTSEQLDMLWHDMDEGRIPGKDTSAWYLEIKTIKDTYPSGTTY